MITEAGTTVAGYLSGLGLDAAKEHFREKLDEKKLSAELTSYIERQRKYNTMCSLAEEIDFQGLIEYIQNKLLDQVCERIFNPNQKKRGKARQEIVDSAVAYSKASTSEAKIHVARCISICLDIIHRFYADQHIAVKDYLFADMIVDAVVDAVAEEVHEAKFTTVAMLENTRNQVLAKGDQILTKIDNNGSLFSYDKAIALAEVGSVGSIGCAIKKVLDHISLEHPYYPHFGYDYRYGMLIINSATKYCFCG